MRKVLIILTLVILVVIFSSIYLSYANIKEKEFIEYLREDINRLLTSKEYDNAFLLLNNQESKYKKILQKEIDAYTNKICQEALSDLSKDILILYKEAGGNYPEVNNTIKQIVNELKRLENLKASAQSYKIAMEAYTNRQFDGARSAFNNVIAEDENYQNAQNYLLELDTRDSYWNTNIEGKNNQTNACTYDGEYMYIPFVLDGIDGIYKIDDEGKAADFFPLSEEACRLTISCINIVGDYIYFIAGEKVGSGYTFKDPYSIYEMKTDGTGLSLVLGGNFTNLYIKGDKVYTISRELGFVEYNRDFVQEKIISGGTVSEFSISEDGIYYTVQADLTHQNINSVYFYDGQESVLVDSDEYLHYYMFNDKYIKYWTKTSSFEVLKYGSNDEDIEIRYGDMYKVYGMFDGKILYSCNGSLGREILYTYQLDNGQTHQLFDSNKRIEFRIEGILYEQERLLIEEDGKLYFSDISCVNRQEIKNIQSDSELLERNSAVINHLDNSNLYTDSSDNKIISVIYDKQNWHYKDDKLNLTIEKRYICEYHTNVYITHIFTTDYKILMTGNANTESLTSKSAYPADKISATYQTVFAQNTDTFLHDKNTEKGIIIRHGQVVRDIFLEDMMVLFEDGTAEIYEYGDEIDAEMLIEKNAFTSFSFGPILVEDYNINSDCVTAYPAARNPRSAIGYVEPGHYVLIACDGRDYEVSRGLNMIQLAQIFEDEGCQLAYNLDGGMSTAVLFMGNYVTHRPKYGTSEWFFYRRIAEIFYVGTNEWSPADLTPFTYDYNYFMEYYK